MPFIPLQHVKKALAKCGSFLYNKERGEGNGNVAGKSSGRNRNGRYGAASSERTFTAQGRENHGLQMAV